MTFDATLEKTLKIILGLGVLIVILAFVIPWHAVGAALGIVNDDPAIAEKKKIDAGATLREAIQRCRYSTTQPGELCEKVKLPISIDKSYVQSNYIGVWELGDRRCANVYFDTATSVDVKPC